MPYGPLSLTNPAPSSGGWRNGRGSRSGIYFDPGRPPPHLQNAVYAWATPPSPPLRIRSHAHPRAAPTRKVEPMGPPMGPTGPPRPGTERLRHGHSTTPEGGGALISAVISG